MTITQDTRQALIDHKVITDVLPGNIDPAYSLTVRWPTTLLDTAGTEVGREDTQPMPIIQLSPVPSQPLENLTLIVTDPDLMMHNDTYFGEVRHALITNISTTPTGTLSIPDGAGISPYIGPAPLPNYLYSRPHRYVFILAQSAQPMMITSDDLRILQKPYVAAFSGNQDAQDLKDRWGFNAQKLIEMKDMRVIGVTFMRVGGTMKSAAANMGLMAEGVVNKLRSMM